MLGVGGIWWRSKYERSQAAIERTTRKEEAIRAERRDVYAEFISTYNEIAWNVTQLLMSWAVKGTTPPGTQTARWRIVSPMIERLERALGPLIVLSPGAVTAEARWAVEMTRLLVIDLVKDPKAKLFQPPWPSEDLANLMSLDLRGASEMVLVSAGQQMRSATIAQRTETAKFNMEQARASRASPAGQTEG